MCNALRLYFSREVNDRRYSITIALQHLQNLLYNIISAIIWQANTVRPYKITAIYIYSVFEHFSSNNTVETLFPIPNELPHHPQHFLLYP